MSHGLIHEPRAPLAAPSMKKHSMVTRASIPDHLICPDGVLMKSSKISKSDRIHSWDFFDFPKMIRSFFEISEKSQPVCRCYMLLLPSHHVSKTPIFVSSVPSMTPKQPVDTLRTVNFTRFRPEDYHEISKRHTIQCTHL